MRRCVLALPLVVFVACSAGGVGGRPDGAQLIECRTITDCNDPPHNPCSYFDCIDGGCVAAPPVAGSVSCEITPVGTCATACRCSAGALVAEGPAPNGTPCPRYGGYCVDGFCMPGVYDAAAPDADGAANDAALDRAAEGDIESAVDSTADGSVDARAGSDG